MRQTTSSKKKISKTNQGIKIELKGQRIEIIPPLLPDTLAISSPRSQIKIQLLNAYLPLPRCLRVKICNLEVHISDLGSDGFGLVYHKSRDTRASTKEFSRTLDPS